MSFNLKQRVHRVENVIKPKVKPCGTLADFAMLANGDTELEYFDWSDWEDIFRDIFKNLGEEAVEEIINEYCRPNNK